MIEQLMELDHGKLGILLGLVAIVSSVLTVMVTLVSYQWRKYREAELEAQIKMAMLDDGMSAADISIVLDAGRKSKRSSGWKQFARQWHEGKRKQDCRP